MKKLQDRVAIVTGGARGIGKAICKQMAEDGAKLAIVDILLDVAEATAAEFRAQGVEARAYAANVAVKESVDTMVDAVTKDFGKIDILVNNAGITKDGLLMRMKEEDWDKVIAVNLKGTFLCTQAVLKPMAKARYGKIVNIASVVGVMGNAAQANYAASKAGVIGFSKSVAKEYASRGIYSNAVAPGYIQTEMTHVLSDEARENFMRVIPMQRPGTPEDVARVVCFLAGPDSDYVTGQVINIDGGMIMA